MKKTFILFIVLHSIIWQKGFIANNVYAQATNSLTWGSEILFKGSKPESLIMGKNGNRFGFGDAKGLSYLQVYKFNSTMEMVQQVRLQSPIGEELIKTLKFRDEIYLLTISKKSKKYIYYLRKLDQDKLTTEDKKVYEIDYSVDKVKERPNIDFIPSDNGNLLFIVDWWYLGNEKVKQLITALDTSLVESWKREMVVPGSEYSGFAYYGDAAGNVYYYNTPRYDTIHIYKAGKDIPSMLDFKLDLDGRRFSGLSMRVFKPGELTCVGFYSTDCDADRYCVKGMYCIIMNNATGPVISSDYKNFGREILWAGMNQKEIEGVRFFTNGRSIGTGVGFRILEFIPRNDGGCTIIGEEQGENSGAYSSGGPFPGGGRTTNYGRTYSFDNVLIMKISGDGKLVWHTVIHRRAIVKPGKIGFAFHFIFSQGNDEYDIYFNDHVDNLDEAKVAKNGVERMELNGKTRCVKMHVASDGSISRKAIAFDSVNHKSTLFSPTLAVQLSDRRFMMYAETKGKIRFADVSINPR